MIKQLMPAGMLGLMVASIFAAFMSTTSVLLNWGSSYMINDLYRRFFVRNASQAHYLLASRTACLLLGLGAVGFAMVFTSLGEFFSMVPQLLTGAVLVMLARYLWWRTNIWSEVSAMLISPFVGLYVEFVLGARHHLPALNLLPGYGIWDAAKANGNDWYFWGERLLTVVGVTTLCWVIVTLLTKPTEPNKLKQFYLLVRPLGPGWRYVRRQFDQPPVIESGRLIFRIWFTGLMLVLGSITSVVDFIRGYPARMVLWAVVAMLGGVLLKTAMKQAKQTSEDITARPVEEVHPVEHSS
jgi:hypothetical protein